MSIRSRRTPLLYLLPIALAACGDKPVSDPRTQAPLVETALVQNATTTPAADMATAIAMTDQFGNLTPSDRRRS